MEEIAKAFVEDLIELVFCRDAESLREFGGVDLLSDLDPFAVGLAPEKHGKSICSLLVAREVDLDAGGFWAVM